MLDVAVGLCWVGNDVRCCYRRDTDVLANLALREIICLLEIEKYDCGRDWLIADWKQMVTQ